MIGDKLRARVLYEEKGPNGEYCLVGIPLYLNTRVYVLVHRGCKDEEDFTHATVVDAICDSDAVKGVVKIVEGKE